MRLAALGFLAAMLVGCGASVKDTPVALTDVPANLMSIAQQKLPDVKFDRAVKRSDGSYEIRGKDKKGKVHDIDLTANGDVIEIE